MELKEGLIGIAFENGYEILRDRGLAIVGMSPGNSYFKKDQIDELLKYCAERFGQVRIMIADKPMEHTYKAMGYSSAKAKRKARLNGNALQNHSQRSIDEVLGDIKLVEWKDEINPHKSYQRELSRVEELYRENDDFRHEIREITRTVLDGKLKQGVEIESAIDEGVNYLLKELAFLSASPEMFGAERVAYVYHDRWGAYEHFVDGKFDDQKRKDLGFVLVK
jgi:cyclo(L-tyrosyl-L-tyrosyl) synthase